MFSNQLWIIIQTAGWSIWTIIAASIFSLAIIIERFYSLRSAIVAPTSLLEKTIKLYQDKQLDEEQISCMAKSSLLGRLFSVALRNKTASRDILKDALEDEGRAVAHSLDKFLTTLGTIAAIAPLLGLLGTVIGMIEIFGSQSSSGTDPYLLAHGISIALYNTAMGLLVAIPSMIFYRHFRAKVDSLLLEMEMQSLKFIEQINIVRDSR